MRVHHKEREKKGLQEEESREKCKSSPIKARRREKIKQQTARMRERGENLSSIW